MIAGRIIKQLTGQSTYAFVKQHILGPLHMTSAVSYNARQMSARDSKGYIRYGLGPLRPAIHEGEGWLNSIGELAMTPRDLAKWDISVINESLLAPRSYKQFEKEVLLNNGTSSGYALGVFVSKFDGRRNIWHDGEVSGFRAENFIFPDDSAAVVVLTNQMAGAAASPIARQISNLLFTQQEAKPNKHTQKAEKFFLNLQKGTLNRSLLTHDADVYFSRQAVKDFKTSLGPLGKPQRFVQTSRWERGGMIGRNYRAVFAHQTLLVFTYHLKNGKLEQYQVAPAN
jgi:hypothetical protein